MARSLTGEAFINAMGGLGNFIQNAPDIYQRRRLQGLQEEQLRQNIGAMPLERAFRQRQLEARTKQAEAQERLGQARLEQSGQELSFAKTRHADIGQREKDRRDFERIRQLFGFAGQVDPAYGIELSRALAEGREPSMTPEQAQAEAINRRVGETGRKASAREAAQLEFLRRRRAAEELGAAEKEGRAPKQYSSGAIAPPATGLPPYEQRRGDINQTARANSIRQQIANNMGVSPADAAWLARFEKRWNKIPVAQTLKSLMQDINVSAPRGGDPAALDQMKFDAANEFLTEEDYAP